MSDIQSTPQSAFARLSFSSVLRTAGFALLLVLINLLWLLPVIRHTRRAASTLALEIADRVRANIGLQIERALTELTLGSEEVAIEPERRDLVLRRLLRKNAGFKSISVVDLAGKEASRVDRLLLVAPADLEDVGSDETFMRARAGASVVGDVFVSDSYEPRVMLAVPVYLAGELSGVLMAELNLRNLIDVLRIPHIAGGTVYVVDRDGFQVLHPNLSELLRRPNFSSRPIVAKVIRGQIATGLALDDAYSNDAGERVFAVGLPIPVAGLSVIVEQPRRQALAVEYQMSAIALVTTLLGVVMFLLIMRANERLRGVSERQRELLSENYARAKLLERQEHELLEANERLRELDRVKSEFVSVAAHQLRTPLTGIRWSLHTLLDHDQGTLTADQEQAVHGALTVTVAAIELINELLDIARMEEGRLGYTIADVPIAPVIAEAVEASRAEAERRGITLSASIDPDLPSLPIDRQKIGIVCANFLSNALKYTGRGGTVALTALRNGSSVEVLVEDTGIGIPASQQHRVFSRFFRASNAQRMSPTGSGLGLFLVKSIVERHGGRIAFLSEEGKGTTMTFSLPIPSNTKGEKETGRKRVSKVARTRRKP